MTETVASPSHITNFIERWATSGAAERANYQIFLTELCDNLDEIVWRLKHLRNKWLSHDADHGKESDIKKDWGKRMDALQWLGVERVPTNKNAYSMIHECLLNKVEQFLTVLLERIAAPSTT